jgi:parvulin-like peptidyl-prolyl isomerase
MLVPSTRAAISLLLAWVVAAGGCGGVPASVVATVNGEPVTRDAFEQFVAVKLGDIAGEPLSDSVRSQLFDEFLKREVTAQAAREHGLRLGQEEIDAKHPRDVPIRAEITVDLLVQKYYREVVLREIEVKPEEVASYYKAHRADFERSSGYYVREIRVATRQEAEQLRSDITSGRGDFEAAARTASLASTAPKSGLAFYETGQLPPVLERAVAPLAVGQTSPVVESTYGFHLFLLEARAAPLSFDRVRGEIVAELRRRKNEQLVKADAERLLDRAQIAIELERLRFQYEGRFAR